MTVLISSVADVFVFDLFLDAHRLSNETQSIGSAIISGTHSTCRSKSSESDLGYCATKTKYVWAKYRNINKNPEDWLLCPRLFVFAGDSFIRIHSKYGTKVAPGTEHMNRHYE